MRYRLLEGSTLLDVCPICDRLSRPLPLRGEFDLVPVSSNSFSTRYHLFDVKLTATDGNGNYTFTNLNAANYLVRLLNQPTGSTLTTWPGFAASGNRCCT